MCEQKWREPWLIYVTEFRVPEEKINSLNSYWRKENTQRQTSTVYDNKLQVDSSEIPGGEKINVIWG